ncbi:hypothetical protein DRN76_04525 [Methanosarcinales archaeon]|nr:MAG: hypothetical protein DRN76_04525 [Methanosarcinales archaeon]
MRCKMKDEELCKLVIIAFGIAIVALAICMFCLLGALVCIVSLPAEEKSIIVVNKTTDLFFWDRDYIILGDDGNVYHTANIEIYNDMKIGRKYDIKTKNLHKCGYPSDRWTIEEVKIPWYGYRK